MEFSKVQLKAIESAGENLLVSASAGSGKTTVMIARVIEKIKKENASLENMLISTFTKKSAMDMRLKLQEKLLAEKKEDPNNPIYDEQLDLLQSADISTISSWCQKIVKTYFYEIDVDPAFEVIEEDESVVMLSKSIDRAVQEEIEKGEEYFSVLYDSMYEKRKDNKLKELIKQVYKFAITQTDCEKWLDDCLNLYDGNYQNERNAILEKVQKSLISQIDEIFSRTTCDKLQKSLPLLRNSILDNEYMSSKMAYGKSEDVYKVKYLREKGKEYIDLYQATEPQKHQIEYAKVIVRLTKTTMKYYREEKDRKAKLDFSDLEHYAYKILQKDEPLQDVKAKYKYLFVDEYQDINPLQQALLELISSKGNTFFVGDLKQSIYAFRNCDPSLFADLYANYESYGFVKPIDFVTNYRCAQEIIDFVNSVFNPIMTKYEGSVDYTKCNLKGKENNEKGEVKIKIYRPSTQKMGICEDYDLLSSVSVDKDTKKIGFDIAYDIVDKAQALLDEKVAKLEEKLTRLNQKDDQNEINNIKEQLEKAGRNYSEIAVLVKKRGSSAYAVYDALKALGVPVHMACDASYKEYPYINLLIQFLRVLDNGNDEIAFASLCASVLVGMSSEDLAVIASQKTNGNFVKKAVHYCEKNSDQLAENIRLVFDLIEKYSKIAPVCTVGELLGKIIADTDYFNRVLYNYEIEGANLLSNFLDMVGDCAYADTVNNFLSYIDNGGDSFEVPPVEGCVNIMTVHSSKGLEFPCVFLIGCDEIDKKDNISLAVCHRKLGLCMQTLNDTEKTYEENGLFTLCKTVKERERYEESMRLLYVALTRAQKSLYLYAKVKPTSENNFYDGVPSMSKTFFGMMSKPIINHGYITVDLDDCATPQLNATQRLFSYREEDANLVSILKKSFDKKEQKSYDNLKTSVTAIAVEKGQSYATEVDKERIKEEKERNNNTYATTKGNAFHKFMEISDFEKPFDEVYDYAVQFVEDYTITDDDKRMLKVAHEKMRELTCGAKIYREKSFVYYWEKRLVQGIIDLLIITEDGAIIVDYKTTSKANLKKADTIEQYRTQIDIYANAVSQILGIKVSKVMLYAFEIDGFIEL